MLLEELLDCDPSVMEKLSDKEYSDLVMPHWTVTRPSMATKVENKNSIKKPITAEEKEKAAKMKKAREIAASMGIKI